MFGFIKKMSLRGKLVLAMLVAANVPILISGALYHSKASSALYEQAMNQLISVREIKKSQIETKFVDTGKQVVDLSSNLMVITATNIFIDKSKAMADDMMLESEDIDGFRQELKQYYQEHLLSEFGSDSRSVDELLPKSDVGVMLQYFYLVQNPHGYADKYLLNAGEDDSIYSSMHEQYHVPLRDFANRFDFDDIVIADMEGRIVYTLQKKAEFGTNIFSGPWKNTQLATALGEAIQSQDADAVIYKDFARYAPTGDKPLSFVATPITDMFGNRLGAVAVAVSVGAINTIMGERSGLGETGETLVFGKDGKLRSISIFEHGHHLLTEEVDVEVAKKALQGEEGAVEAVNSSGQEVLVAYTPLNLGGITWGLLAKIDRDEALAVTSELQNLLVIVSALVLLVAIGLAWMVGRSVNRELGGEPSTIAQVAGDIANGNLVLTPDEDQNPGGAIGELMRMRSRLTEIIHEIKKAAGLVEAGACEIDRGNKMVVEQTEQQLTSLEQTAASMEQMTSTVKKNADNTKEAKTLVKDTKEQADQGAAVLSEAVGAMEEIKASSEQISAITGVIDEIAFQTNLLALNAAVEAARAGDQGRGFAVVATEVRNLAGRSAEAAKQIKALIDDSTSKVEGGTTLVNESGKMLLDINASIQKVNEIIDSIADASEEQYQGIQVINRSILEIEQVTQKNTGLMKELAESGMAMGRQAENLNKQVGFFHVGDDEKPRVSGTSRFERRSKERPWSQPKGERQERRRGMA